MGRWQAVVDGLTAPPSPMRIVETLARLVR
jgi:hypothetical protein